MKPIKIEVKWAILLQFGFHGWGGLLFKFDYLLLYRE